MTEPHKTMEEKRVRNIYLSQMIMCMNDRKLVIPFNASPKPGPLSLDGVFKQITTKPNAQLEEEEKVSSCLYIQISIVIDTNKIRLKKRNFLNKSHIDTVKPP